MRPNTPHYVLAVDHSITNGRHFYSTSTITQTVFGIVHCMIMSTAITSKLPDTTRPILHQLMALWFDHYCVEGLAPSKKPLSLDWQGAKMSDH